jgi:hypothetical protein
VLDCERPQSVYRLGNHPLHHASEMEPTHRAVDWNVRKESPRVGAHVDDAGMRARAKNDQSQVEDMCHQHALVHEQGIGLPGTVGAGPTQMVGAALLERGQPRNLATISRSGRRAAAGRQAD